MVAKIKNFGNNFFHSIFDVGAGVLVYLYIAQYFSTFWGIIVAFLCEFPIGFGIECSILHISKHYNFGGHNIKLVAFIVIINVVIGITVGLIITPIKYHRLLIGAAIELACIMINTQLFSKLRVKQNKKGGIYGRV